MDPSPPSSLLRAAFVFVALALVPIPVAGPAAAAPAGALASLSPLAAPDVRLVQTEDPVPAVEELSPEERESAEAAYDDFLIRFNLMNERIGEVMGEPPFAGIEHAGGYTVRLTSNDWWKESRGQHQRNALVLYSMWAEVNGRRPVKLIIADKSGGDYIIVEGTPRGMKYLERK